jgi:hypothetical protein
MVALLVCAAWGQQTETERSAGLSPAAVVAAVIQSGLRWNSLVSGSGMALDLSDAAGASLLRVACVRDPALMTIVVETFQAIVSEESLSFGLDGEVFVFVANPPGQRPYGVEAEAPIRGELLDHLETAREVSAIYGAQGLGPYLPPDEETTERFVTTCRRIAGL